MLAIDGGVTLIFAVDTTGSMGEEIVESKKIATDIVNEQRFAAVEYILSPFNDPRKIWAYILKWYCRSIKVKALLTYYVIFHHPL